MNWQYKINDMDGYVPFFSKLWMCGFVNRTNSQLTKNKDNIPAFSYEKLTKSHSHKKTRHKKNSTLKIQENFNVELRQSNYKKKVISRIKSISP